MSNSGDQRLDAMCERLSATPKRAARRLSVADDVRALLDVIQTQRRAGKTWEQIAEEMYGATKSPGAVRTAYNRQKRGRKSTQPRRMRPRNSKSSSGPEPTATAVSIETTSAQLSRVSGLFDAMSSPARSPSAERKSERE
jgi:hypothetical protein